MTSYAEKISLEQYIDAGGEMSTLLQHLSTRIPEKRRQSIEAAFDQDLTHRAAAFGLLTAQERESVEQAIAAEQLEGNESNGLCCVASYTVTLKKIYLRFQADIEDDGSCIDLRTPYDERDGMFLDLTSAVTRDWW